ncbi:MAG TPA: sigma-54 dependent transcriptional regulator [Opitutaceae bacterium]
MNGVRLKNAAVLVLDDEVLLRRRISAYLERAGADVTQAGTVAEARSAASAMPFDFALLDVNLPDGRGTDLLAEKAFGAGTSVLVMTAEGGVAGAVEAMRLGASDYLTKPFDVEELPVRLERARRLRQHTRAEEHRRSQEAGGADEFYFGSSLGAIETQLQRILEADRRLKSHFPPVLIEGETGTGKTTIARWIHRRGPRADGPLVEVNCSALPEGLAESELFGHEKGAFTDAKAARIGLLEAADGGTLFLDELPSLSLPLQAKLLTALEDHAIRRVGGTRTQSIDARIVTATNADLRQLVAGGKFREDLFHRLDLFRVQLPPLRERGEDIIELAGRLLTRICRRYSLPVSEIPAAGRKRLLAHQWPGNVRELAHEIERAVVFDGGDLRFEALARRVFGAASSPEAGEPAWLREGFVFPEEGFSIDDATNELVRRALEQAGGNVSAAARLLGATRDFVRYRLKDREGGA